MGILASNLHRVLKAAFKNIHNQLQYELYIPFVLRSSSHLEEY